MGFSVSASTVVIIVGLLMSAYLIVPSISQAEDDITEGMDASHDQLKLMKNADFKISNTTTDSANGTVTVEVTNTGTETLTLKYIDFLFDGVREVPDSLTIAGESGRTFISPGETLTATFSFSDMPTRLKIAIETGQSKATSL